jgi:hypothetical protein
MTLDIRRKHPMNKRRWTLENLPAANSQNRKMMLNIINLPEYREDIGRGLPFFSEEELEEIEGKYRDEGMTRKDIVTEAYKKGWLLKESTLKSYIQKDQLPRPVKRLKTDKGAISIYPPNTIRHLNFVRYCLFTGSKAVDSLMNIMKHMSVGDEAHLKATSVEIDDSGADGDDCIHSIYIGLARLETGIAWTEESIEKAFLEYPSKSKQYLRYIVDIKKIKEQFETTLDKFMKALKESTTQVDLGKVFPAPIKGEEGEE